MKTVLLIDDDAVIRAIFSLALRRRGYEVVEAGSGDEGYEKARNQPPDLVLTDISMPNGNGQSVLQRIRHDPRLRSQQVVLMTGKPDAFNSRAGMEAGADDFLLKPFTQEALLRCVEARLQRAELSRAADTKRRVPLPPHLSHEFFTPLNGIIGLIEFLVGEPDQITLGTIRSELRDVLKTGTGLHRTLRNYLLILQLEAGEESNEAAALEKISGAETRQALLSGINQSLTRTERKNVRVVLDEIPLAVSPPDLSIIAEELLENASNFSAFGQPVEIRLRRDGLLTVTDTGRGMRPEEVEQIGAFRQFDRKKYEQQGLGLGLVLVQHLATKCGASFSIKSTWGTGTCVTIAFPAADPSGSLLPDISKEPQK